MYRVFVLLLLLFGLLTLFRKVRDKLSLTYLLQSNGQAVWLALLLFGAVNWPGVITRYNLSANTRSEVDLYYLTNDVAPRQIAPATALGAVFYAPCVNQLGFFCCSRGLMNKNPNQQR